MLEVTMKFAGIDGCRGGWFAVVLDKNQNWQTILAKNIEELWPLIADVERALIDIPIGLPAIGERECDLLARKMLGRRASSIFLTPVRPAVYAESYAQACQINQRLSGKKISLQSWNICPKIREVDQFLQRYPSVKNDLVESHPELLFKSLDATNNILVSKKSKAGFVRRIFLLQKHLPSVGQIVENMLHSFSRNELAKDDILDALVLALVAGTSLRRWRTFHPESPTDAIGNPMQIVY